MKKLNKKGFTLVELLAVIVVLAIIMVLTLPTIMNSMSSARQSTFLLYANRMLDTAADKYQSDALLGSGKTCYTIKELNGENTSNYKGKVLISNDGTTYTIQMYDANYQIGITASDTLGDKAGGVGYKDIDGIKGKLSSSVKLQTVPATLTEAFTAANSCS
mgnify:FL=1